MEDNVHPEAAARTEIADTKRDAAAHDNDFGHVEKVMSADESDMKDHVNHNLVDQEVSKYTDGEVIHVSEEDSKRLRKLIDRRVLVVMIITYFIQVGWNPVCAMDRELALISMSRLSTKAPCPSHPSWASTSCPGSRPTYV